MPQRDPIEHLAKIFRLTPYQIYVLQQYGHKYNLDKLAKQGALLYAPYKCELTRSWTDAVAKIFLGPRADLIGPDEILVYDQRGIRLYKSGFYRAMDENGHSYYADQHGNILDRANYPKRMQ